MCGFRPLRLKLAAACVVAYVCAVTGAALAWAVLNKHKLPTVLCAASIGALTGAGAGVTFVRRRDVGVNHTYCMVLALTGCGFGMYCGLVWETNVAGLLAGCACAGGFMTGAALGSSAARASCFAPPLETVSAVADSVSFESESLSESVMS